MNEGLCVKAEQHKPMLGYTDVSSVPKTVRILQVEQRVQCRWRKTSRD